MWTVQQTDEKWTSKRRCGVFHKGCLVNHMKEYDVKLSLEIIPMNIFLSSSENLNIQIAYKGFELDQVSDHLVISSDECNVERTRNRITDTVQLNCSKIVEGWHQTNITITPTDFSIGFFLNYKLDHNISHLVASANNTSYCEESSPTWDVKETNTYPIKIPLKGLNDVNLILESDEIFSPIINIMGNYLSFSWKQDSISMSQGPPLPGGKYFMFLYNKSEKNMFTVKTGKSIECDCEAIFINLGGPVDELDISSKHGRFYFILNLDDKIVSSRPNEPQPIAGEPTARSKWTIVMIVIILILLAGVVVSIVACQFGGRGIRWFESLELSIKKENASADYKGIANQDIEGIKTEADNETNDTPIFRKASAKESSISSSYKYSDEGGDVRKRNRPNQDKELYEAVISGDYNRFQEAIKLDEGINYKEPDNDETPLHAACWKGDLQFVLELLQKGADIENKTSLGMTALQAACDQGHLQIVQKLIEKKANLDNIDNYGVTPLDVARREGRKEVEQVLLKALGKI